MRRQVQLVAAPAHRCIAGPIRDRFAPQQLRAEPAQGRVAAFDQPGRARADQPAPEQHAREQRGDRPPEQHRERDGEQRRPEGARPRPGVRAGGAAPFRGIFEQELQAELGAVEIGREARLDAERRAPRALARGLIGPGEPRRAVGARRARAEQGLPHAMQDRALGIAPRSGIVRQAKLARARLACARPRIGPHDVRGEELRRDQHLGEVCLPRRAGCGLAVQQLLPSLRGAALHAIDEEALPIGGREEEEEREEEARRGSQCGGDGGPHATGAPWEARDGSGPPAAFPSPPGLARRASPTPRQSLACRPSSALDPWNS